MEYSRAEKIIYWWRYKNYFKNDLEINLVELNTETKYRKIRKSLVFLDFRNFQYLFPYSFRIFNYFLFSHIRPQWKVIIMGFSSIMLICAAVTTAHNTVKKMGLLTSSVLGALFIMASHYCGSRLALLASLDAIGWLRVPARYVHYQDACSPGLWRGRGAAGR